MNEQMTALGAFYEMSAYINPLIDRVEGKAGKIASIALVAMSLMGCQSLIIDSTILAQESTEPSASLEPVQIPSPYSERDVCQMGLQNLPRAARCNPDADPAKVKAVFGGDQ